MHRVTRMAARTDGIFDKDGITISCLRRSKRAKSNCVIHSPWHKTTYVVRGISGPKFYIRVTDRLEREQAYPLILTCGFYDVAQEVRGLIDFTEDPS